MEGGREPQQAPKSDAKKRLVLKIIVVLAIIIILVVVFLSSAPADPYDTVDNVMADPAKYVDKEVEIRGKVTAWSQLNSTFNLTGEAYSIVVSYTYVPDSFATGKDVVVTGMFHLNVSTYEIDADDILVGCASRY